MNEGLTQEDWVRRSLGAALFESRTGRDISSLSAKPDQPLTPEKEAWIAETAAKLDAAEANSPYFVNGEFVEPEDDPDGFDRRMTGI